jgi:hypothetical protein
MKTIQDVFGLWRPLSSLARELDELPDTVKHWKHRGKIPPRCWARVCKAAKAKGTTLTVHRLMELHCAPTSGAQRKTG